MVPTICTHDVLVPFVRKRLSFSGGGPRFSSYPLPLAQAVQPHDWASSPPLPTLAARFGSQGQDFPVRPGRRSAFAVWAILAGLPARVAFVTVCGGLPLGSTEPPSYLRVHLGLGAAIAACLPRRLAGAGACVHRWFGPGQSPRPSYNRLTCIPACWAGVAGCAQVKLHREVERLGLDLMARLSEGAVSPFCLCSRPGCCIV